ncbi:MAG: RecX family transcriptional regulator [Desulfobacteraceae bacterium]|jgi:SOS response regulatory protein OraA/RecX
MQSPNSNQSAYRQALNTAIRLLSQRAHTYKELEMKLRRRHFTSRAIVKVLSECQRLKYIDDEAAALQFVKARKRKHYGPRQIEQVMKKKRIFY